MMHCTYACRRVRDSCRTHAVTPLTEDFEWWNVFEGSCKKMCVASAQLCMCVVAIV